MLPFYFILLRLGSLDLTPTFIDDCSREAAILCDKTLRQYSAVKLCGNTLRQYSQTKLCGNTRRQYPATIPRGNTLRQYSQAILCGNTLLCGIVESGLRLQEKTGMRLILPAACHPSRRSKKSSSSAPDSKASEPIDTDRDLEESDNGVLALTGHETPLYRAHQSKNGPQRHMQK
jgi:hypothetical protein